ncbi:ErpC protein [Borreliella kurtenbachii]|uniref:ErpC protein n=1 Tax=Borreliella kurtenbachii TaxID=1196056 RepID=UPI0034635F5D
MNKKMFIICAVFALISSCKNFATSKDIKQNAGEKVQGFVDKILDPVKDKIASSGSKADEVAKKLQEEELMQGDDPDNGVINPPPALLANGQDNTPVLKEKQQSDVQQEGKSEKAKVEKEKEEQKDTEGNAKKIKVAEEQKKQQEEVKTKAEKERKAKAEEQQKEQKRQQEEQQRKAKAEKEKREKEEAEQQKREEEAKEKAEKRQVGNQIKTLTAKIDEINENIDVIAAQASVGAQGVIDRITGPVYDDFTEDNNSIRKTWDLEDEYDSGLGKLLKELSEARDGLRTKLNEGNKSYAGIGKEPDLKENVNVSEIKEDLEKVKSKLEEVKKYLEDESNFEEIKEYIAGSDDDYDEED